MKKLIYLLSVITIISGSISCKNKVNVKENIQFSNASDVTVLYFHFTRRCSTCLAVEENSRKAVEELYPNQVKTGEYSFTAMNLDDSKTKEIADKLGVGGQCLLVIHGEKKIDITSEAWLAAHDYEKMKTEIKSGIEKVLF